MPALLRIDTGSRVAGSFSRTVTDSFEKAWRETHPDGEVLVRDLGSDPVPHLDEHGVAARALPAEQHSPQQAAAAARREELVAELHAADTWVFSVPMYNWSIPSALKAWIDTVVGPGMTFPGTRAVVVAARGGGYSPGTPKEHWNHQTPYLQLIFDVLEVEVEFIDAELTLAPVVPALAELIDVHEQGLTAAHERAEELARAA
jgi:FMN-dependent NADH-azoreductase